MYEKILKDSAASTKAWASRRKTTAANTKETYKLIRQAAGLTKPAKKTDTAHINSMAATLGIV